MPKTIPPKLVELACDEGAGRVETMVGVSGGWGWVRFSAVGGFDSAVRWRSRAGSTGFAVFKLVEPGCDEGAARVETMVTLPGDLWPDLFLDSLVPVADGGSRSPPA